MRGPRPKLTDEQLCEINEKRLEGWTWDAIAHHYGTSAQTAKKLFEHKRDANGFCIVGEPVVLYTLRCFGCKEKYEPECYAGLEDLIQDAKDDNWLFNATQTVCYCPKCRIWHEWQCPGCGAWNIETADECHSCIWRKP